MSSPDQPSSIINNAGNRQVAQFLNPAQGKNLPQRTHTHRKVAFRAKASYFSASRRGNFSPILQILNFTGAKICWGGGRENACEFPTNSPGDWRILCEIETGHVYTTRFLHIYSATWSDVHNPSHESKNSKSLLLLHDMPYTVYTVYSPSLMIKAVFLWRILTSRIAIRMQKQSSTIAIYSSALPIGTPAPYTTTMHRYRAPAAPNISLVLYCIVY